MFRARNSATAALVEWLVISFATILKLVRDNKRSEQDIKGLKIAMQTVIDGKPFCYTFYNLGRSAKELATSTDPVEIHALWERLYNRWGFRYSVPPVPYDSHQIAQKKGRILIYLAPELSTTELSESFPEMGLARASYRVRRVTREKGNNAKDREEEDLLGWLFVEKSLKTPHLNTSGVDLERIFADQCARGMTLNAYVIFGKFCKEIFGKYPDINSRVWLLGSICVWGGDFSGSSYMDTSFRRNGRLREDLGWSAGASDPHLGGRSVAQ